MSGTVPRTCTEILRLPANGHPMDSGLPKADPRPLSDFRSRATYVLLGDPGAGKTTAFEDEARTMGDEAHPVSARDFLLPREAPPEWKSKTLFIDGLDEVRAGKPDARGPFDRIRRRLIELEKPRFRLSCRDADWLGENDRKHLATVSSNGKVVVLRLDPLTESNILKILGNHPGITDPERFVSAARDRGIDGLLTNPQTLAMLADVVGGGGEWPASRLDTFEKACHRIVREHNEEHRASRGPRGAPPAPPGQLLDVAGLLCAVHLLTGTAGFTLRHEDDDQHLDPDECGYELVPDAHGHGPSSHDVVRHVLGTKLFKGQSDHRLAPIHRHVAEYLGARHLAKLVKERLPVRRVLALMTGYDGAVVTELRGLSAWLAAQCPAARPELIERDPVGVGQYGDVREFKLHEKQTLLEALKDAREFMHQKQAYEGVGGVASLRALATSNLEPAFEKFLSSSSRDKEHQRFIGFVLEILIEGAPMTGLSGTLLEIVQDATWWSSVRTRALDAFCHGHHGRDKSAGLKALLTGIREGDIADPDDELLGTLLARLYPQELSPRDVWDLFTRPQNPDLFGRYRWFWKGLPESSPDDHVMEHLDHLSQSPPRFGAWLYIDSFQRLRLGLVARGLDLHGDKLVAQREIPRLHDWLGVASARDAADWDPLGSEAIGKIRRWLGKRPDVQKAVAWEGMSRCPGGKEFSGCAFDVEERLYGSRPPPDYGAWYLSRAVSMAPGMPEAAEHLLICAFRSINDDRINQGLSLRRIEEGVRGIQNLEATLARLKSPRPSALKSKMDELEKRHRIQRREEKERELNFLRSQVSALRANQAPPKLLHEAARIYFRDFQDIATDKDAGVRAVEARFGGDRRVKEAILAGLRGVPSRKDVPSLKEIVRVCREGSSHYLGLPFLAGLAELERTQPESPPACKPLDDDESWDERTAIAFYFSAGSSYLGVIHTTGAYQPAWYLKLLEERPEVVADAQVHIARTALAGDAFVDCRLRQLAFDENYACVARYSALRLLWAFPVQGKHKYGQDLIYLLLAALRYSNREALRELIDVKLSRSSLSVWQRTYWLMAGLVISPSSYADRLWNHVQACEIRDEYRRWIRDGRLAELTRARFLLKASAVSRT